MRSRRGVASRKGRYRMHHRKKQILRAQNGVPAFPKKFKYDMFTVFATFIVDGLRHFRSRNMHSYPQDFEGHVEDWPKTIDKMIWSFNQIANDYPDDPHSIFFKAKVKEAEKRGIQLMTLAGNTIQFHDILDDGRPSDEEMKAYHDRVQEGINLFAKYFQDLWD